MADNIKGITVTLGADTTALSSALADVNKKSKALQGELKEVEKLLRVDPGNMDLVAQKQRVLQESIEQTSNKLTQLRSVQEQVNRQFANGEINESQFRAFNREIARTEQQLGSLQNQMQRISSEQIRVQINGDSTSVTRALEDVSNKGRRLQGELKELDRLLQFNPDSVELLAQKQQVLTESINNTSEKLGRLRSMQEQVNQQFERGEIGPEQYRQFQREVARTEQELRNFNEQMGDTERRLRGASEETSNLGERFSAIGGKLTGVGKALTIGLTAPILAATAAMAKAAIDFDSSSSHIEAALGVSSEKAEELAKTARGIWSEGFGESMGDVNAALITTKTNLQNLSKADLDSLTEKALILQETFGAEINESTRTASVLMRNFGIEGNKAMDLITYGFQHGLDFSDELLDTLREYAPQFKAAGFSAEEMMGILQKGAENGAFNLDKVGDAVKEFNIRIKDGSKGVSQALDMLFAPEGVNEFAEALAKGGKSSKEYAKVVALSTKEVADSITEKLGKGGETAGKAMTSLFTVLSGGGDILDGLSQGTLTAGDAMTKVIEALSKIEDPLERAQLGVALFGTQWEDLESDVMLAMGSGVEAITGFEGATDKAGKAIRESFGNRLQSTWRELQTSLLPLGQQLLDIAEEVMPSVQTAIGAVTTVLGSMSPEAQKATLAIGGIAAAVGPVLIAVGSLVTTLAPLVSSAGGITAVGGSIAAIAGPIGWVAAGIAAIVAGSIALYKNWDKVLSLSPVWQALIFTLAGPAVTGIVAMIKGIQYATESSIPAMQGFGDTVSEATTKAVTGYLDLNTQATNALNQLNWSGTAVTKETAANITNTFSEMNAKILSSMQQKNTEQLDTLRQYFAGYSGISAEEEQKILGNIQKNNEEQQQHIQENQDRIAEILNKAKEQKRALTEAEKNEINAIQKEMTTSAVKNMSDSEVEQLAIMAKLKQEAGNISAQQAAEVVKSSVKQKDEAVKAANEQYDKTVAAIIRQRDESGTITDAQAEKLIANAKKQRDESVKAAEDMHQKVVSEAKKQAGDHADQVDFETGEVLKKWEVLKNKSVAVFKELWSQTKNYFSKLGSDIKQDADQIKTNISTSFEKAKSEAKRIFTELVNAVGNKAAEIKTKIKTKMDEAKAVIKSVNLTQIGKDFIQGLINGIKSKANEVKQEAERIAQNAAMAVKNLWKERSPSRLTKEYGEFFSEGLRLGIKNKGKGVTDASEEVAKNAITPLTKAMEKIDSNAAAAAAGSKKSTDKIKKAFSEAFATAQSEHKVGRLDTDDYIKALQQIQSQYAKTSDQSRKITQEISNQHKNLAKEQTAAAKAAYEASKSFIDKRVEDGSLSLTKELAAWQKVQDQYAKGSEQRKAAEEEAGNVRVEIYKRLSEASDNFLAKTKEVNDKVAAEEEALNKKYEDAVTQRAAAINDFAGLFDAVNSKSEQTGQELLDNLKGQVDYLKTWSTEIAKLAKRGIDEGLLAELRELGPKALPQLMALNQLTDQQLTEYSSLWLQKSAEARTQAVTELSGMKDETTAQVAQLHKDAAAEMDGLKKDFMDAVKSISNGSKNEFNAMNKSLNQIGKQSMQGLLNGLKSMKGEVVAQAKEIADSVSRTMQKALDIHSPSREMKWIGEMAGQGLVNGMASMVSNVKSQASTLATAAMPLLGQTEAGTAMSSSGSTQVSISMEGMFAGANISVRSDEDITKLAQQIAAVMLSQSDQSARGRGLSPR